MKTWIVLQKDKVEDSSTKILGFGDSVINGGAVTEHDSLATSILSDTLSKISHSNFQFLNISAASWGPDNCFAYLKKHGDFNAKRIILFVSSHDAYDNMEFRKLVGVSTSYPDQQYKLAIYELLDRYLLPRLFKNYHEELAINETNLVKPFNPGFESFHQYALEKQIPFTLYLHAEVSELKEQKYNQEGQDIIKFAKANNIEIIEDLHQLSLDDYRDHIHLNTKGQRSMAMLVLPSIVLPD